MRRKDDKNQCDTLESERFERSDSQFRFSGCESELKDRLRALIGGEPVASFARRCGMDETLIRKYLRGSQPSAKNLAVIARVAGVTTDWLATGEGVRTRAELAALQRGRGAEGLLPPDHPHARRWAALIQLVEEEPDEARRDSILSDLLTRAQEAAELAQLRRAVLALTRDRKAG